MNIRLFLFIFSLLLFCFLNSNGQGGVAINTDGSAAHSSAILDVYSITKGLLIPRLSEEQIYNIDTPAAGLVVFNSDQLIPVYFDGYYWRKFDGSNMTAVNNFPDDALFVATTGCDMESCGDIENPFETIGYALIRALNLGSEHIYVANGTYNETVEMEDGINLYGGYDPDTWARNLSSTQTILQGAGSLNDHTVTVRAENITLMTRLEGFVIYGTACSVAGHNSYAIYVLNATTNLEIKSNYIYAASGAAGQAGTAGANGVNGANGTGRESDPGSYDAFNTGQVPCGAGNDRQHSNGGVMIAGADDISGGNGGGNQCPPVYDSESSGIDGFNGNSGDGGGGGAGGLGGDAGDDCQYQSGNCFIPTQSYLGMDGTNGGDGDNGTGGSGGSNQNGSISSGHWVATAGTSGAEGSNGGGGGGGGAGGGSDYISGSPFGDVLGAHGGGGGSGGAGGAGGTGGEGGGGSFGIFVLNGNAPDITGNTIFLGYGGNGGNGGTGGDKGLGGLGANGGQTDSGSFCGWQAGKGGNGGSGGFGGGGGGGCGGNAYGIYTYNVSGSTSYLTENYFSGGTAGSGGNGGYSPGNSGNSGSAGLVVNYGNY